jgi:hypothetical protein
MIEGFFIIQQLRLRNQRAGTAPGGENRVDPDKLNELDRNRCSRKRSSRPSACSRDCNSNTGCEARVTEDGCGGAAAHAAVSRRAAPAHRPGRAARRRQDHPVRGGVERGATRGELTGTAAALYRECTVQIGLDEASLVDLPGIPSLQHLSGDDLRAEVPAVGRRAPAGVGARGRPVRRCRLRRPT